MKTFRNACALLSLIASVAAASTIRVPQDQPTIQDGINAAQNGDTVLVSTGTYPENINFIGKAITVVGADGATATKIVGGGSAAIVTFSSGESRSSVLTGFTITDGNAGGILVAGSSPTIIRNIITGNTNCSGDGVSVGGGGPLIQDNEITDNRQSGCSGGEGGGGILLVAGPDTEIIHNLIARNDAATAPGGGISMDAGGTALIENNLIINNNSSVTGGGISLYNDPSDALIIQNLIVGNTAPQGGGIYFLIPSGSSGPLVVNNTIIGGADSPQGSAVWASGFDTDDPFFNNIMIGLSGQNAVWCDGTYSQQPPTFTNNEAWSANGTGLQGTCASESHQNGNISANPQFVSPFKGNFQLQSTSPAINAGDNNAPDLPSRDLAGHPRIVGGIVDMGAFEYQGNLPPERFQR